MSDDLKIWRTNDLCAALKISRGTVNNWVRNGHLPKPFQLGPRAVGWDAAEIKMIMLSRARGTHK